MARVYSIAGSTRLFIAPGVVNRTFGNRTQSPDWVRLGSAIELNRTRRTPIERNRTFGNRTLQPSNIIEHFNNQKHEPVTSGVKQSVAVK